MRIKEREKKKRCFANGACDSGGFGCVEMRITARCRSYRLIRGWSHCNGNPTSPLSLSLFVIFIYISSKVCVCSDATFCLFFLPPSGELGKFLFFFFLFVVCNTRNFTASEEHPPAALWIFKFLFYKKKKCSWQYNVNFQLKKKCCVLFLSCNKNKNGGRRERERPLCRLGSIWPQETESIARFCFHEAQK